MREHDRSEPARETCAPEPAHDIPATATWRRRNRFRALVLAGLAAAAAAVGWTARQLVDDRADGRLDLLVAAVLAAVGLWALVTATPPRVIHLHGSLLEVGSARGMERFDLTDPTLQLDLLGNPRSRTWQLVVHRLDGSVLRLDAHDTEPVILERVVRHYAAFAERRRSQHWSLGD